MGGVVVRRAWWGAVVGVGVSRGQGASSGAGPGYGAGRVWRRPIPWSRRRVQGWSAL